MTGDWAGAGGGVQVVRSGHVEGSEVPVVVLNNIQLSKDTYLVSVNSLLPDTFDGICSRRGSPAPCRQTSRE